MIVQILIGDARTRMAELPDASVQCCVTSPPYYGLRDYGCDGQIGLEETPDAYVAELVAVFREVRRVLRHDGTLWLNIGDSYAGSGKGGNPEEGKQATNRGSQTVGVLYGKTGETAREAAVTNVTRRTFRAGNPDKNGGVSNRNGLGAVGGGNIKAKDLIGIPWLLAFALRADGWYLRQEIIWAKPNPMPESVTDRCTRSHEQIFMLSKSARYYYDAESIAEQSTYAGKIISLGEKSLSKGQATGANVKASGNGLVDSVTVNELRNKRDVWTVNTQPYAEAHFATFPPALIEPCILAGCPKGGSVLDPFCGAGTSLLVADRLERNGIGIELNPEYASMARNRVYDDAPLFADVSCG